MKWYQFEAVGKLFLSKKPNHFVIFTYMYGYLYKFSIYCLKIMRNKNNFLGDLNFIITKLTQKYQLIFLNTTTFNFGYFIGVYLNNFQLVIFNFKSRVISNHFECEIFLWFRTPLHKIN